MLKVLSSSSFIQTPLGVFFGGIPYMNSSRFLYTICTSSKRAQYMDVLQNYTSFSFCFCYCCFCSSPSFLSQHFFSFSIWFIRFCAIHMMNNNKPLYKLLVTYDYIFYGFENICYSRLLLLFPLFFFVIFSISFFYLYPSECT